MSLISDKLENRHEGVKNAGKWLEPNPNLPEPQYNIALHVEDLAAMMLMCISKDSPQLTIALNNLLVAKDAFIRASLEETLYG